MKHSKTLWVALLTSLSVMSGCATGGPAATERGAASEVKGDVVKINEKAKTVLQQMNIQVVGNQTKDSGKVESLEGKSGETNVTVNMTQTNAETTNVEVIARESTFKWNKDYANQILAKIVQQP